MVKPTVYREILPRFIFALFALWPEGEFKNGLIEFRILKDNVRKMESGQIQDWANQSQIVIGRKLK